MARLAYRMYFAGFDKTGLTSGQIGMATSDDGITWTKYDDPATTDAPYAESDPVLTAPEGITFVQQPMVVQEGDHWVMVFRQVDYTARPVQMSLNYATSSDGIHWQIASDTPFWGRTTVPGSNGFWSDGTGAARRHLLPLRRDRHPQRHGDFRRHA